MTQMSVTGIIAAGCRCSRLGKHDPVGSVLARGGIAAYTLTNLGYPIPVWLAFWRVLPSAFFRVC